MGILVLTSAFPARPVCVLEDQPIWPSMQTLAIMILGWNMLSVIVTLDSKVSYFRTRTHPRKITLYSKNSENRDDQKS